MGTVWKIIKKVGCILADFVEVYLPITVFLMLFITFLVNIYFRYVLRNPQNWTFEFSIYTFVIVGLLGACTAYRKEDHVIFDLLYTRLGAKGQNILRMLSYLLIIVFFTYAIPGSILFLYSLHSKNIVSVIMKIPVWIPFSSFSILLISVVIRSILRLAMDVKSFINKTYIQTYNIEEKL